MNVVSYAVIVDNFVVGWLPEDLVVMSADIILSFFTFNKHFWKFRSYSLGNCFLRDLDSHMTTHFNDSFDIREHSSFSDFFVSQLLGDGEGSFVKHGVIHDTGFGHGDSLPKTREEVHVVTLRRNTQFVSSGKRIERRS